MSLVTGNNSANYYRQSDYLSSKYDTIIMYGGNDTVILDLAGRQGGSNDVNMGTGNDRVVNYFEGDNVIRMGDGNDTYDAKGTWNSSTYSFYDVVFGGTGGDTFYVRTNVSEYRGESGNDTFYAVGLNNIINGGAGNDTLSYALQDTFWDLSGTGIWVNLSQQRAWNDFGDAEIVKGIENVDGTSAHDRLIGSDGNNILKGLGGDDTIEGRGGNDRIFAGAGIDTLNGGSGNDTMRGGTQADTLTGGLGADIFVFGAINESTVGKNKDVITDFNGAQGDIIDLSAIDADVTSAGNNAFTFISGASFSGTAGELRYGGNVVYGDVDGDGAADFAISISNGAALISSHFDL